MNIRRLGYLPLILLVASCASTVKEHDYSLQWTRDSARLVVVDADGTVIRPFGGKYVGVPGYVFSGDAIAMHPGTRRIQHICPLPEGAIEVLDVAPSLVVTFKAGHKYELSCKNGAPKIRELQ